MNHHITNDGRSTIMNMYIMNIQTFFGKVYRISTRALYFIPNSCMNHHAEIKFKG